MRAEVTGSGDELVIELRAADLPGGEDISPASLRKGLASTAGDVAAGILQMLGQPQPPGEPRQVRAVTVRLVKVVTIGEATIMLPDGAEVFA